MPFDDTMFIKRNVNVLAFFTEEQLRRVTAEIERQICPKGQTVIFQGEISHNFHIIKRGRVQVFAKAGGERTLLAELG
jgi:CRP-like cAMP-binding protein